MGEGIWPEARGSQPDAWVWGSSSSTASPLCPVSLVVSVVNFTTLLLWQRLYERVCVGELGVVLGLAGGLQGRVPLTPAVLSLQCPPRSPSSLAFGRVHSAG